MTNEIIIALASILIGFCLGRLGDWLNIRRMARKERLDNLINPIVSFHKRVHKACALDFSDIAREDQEQFINILVYNSIYSDKFLNENIYEFISEFGVEDLQDDERRVKLNHIYNSILEYVYVEWLRLTRNLYWPWYSRIINYLKNISMKKVLKKYNKQNEDALYWINN
jgi:hypothetical protein